MEMTLSAESLARIEYWSERLPEGMEMWDFSQGEKAIDIGDIGNQSGDPSGFAAALIDRHDSREINHMLVVYVHDGQIDDDFTQALAEWDKNFSPNSGDLASRKTA